MKNRSFNGLIIFLAATSAFAGAYVPPSTAVSKINSYRGYSELTKAAAGMDIDQYAYNMTTWQIANGGFYKAMADKYKSAYSGGEKSEWRAKDGGDLATIDNNATVQEMRLLAIRYKETTNANYKAAFKTSFNKAVNFLLTMQRNNGGLPQVWPKRGNYSDHITLNDNAMIRAMVTMMDIANKAAPFDSDIIDEATRGKMGSAMDKAIDYLLKAQIKNGNALTVWCAQHDTVNYAPRGARAYELPSKSGNESMGVVWFLMNWPKQTPEIQTAVKSAIAWYKKNKLSNTAFSKTQGIIEKNGSSLWFRFYEVDRDAYFFCDRGGESTKTQDFFAISQERREGYQWAGDYGSAILSAEIPYLTALEKIDDSYVEPPSPLPAVAMCGSDTCKTVLQGENFLEIDGFKESTNAGFIGEGYANVNNVAGSFVKYGVTADVAKGSSEKFSLYIRYANGGKTARDFSILLGESEIASGSMETTGSWTEWKTLAVEVELPRGYSEITFKSLSGDGMANIDAIGWMSGKLFAEKVDLQDSEGENKGEGTSIKSKEMTPQKNSSKSIFGNFGEGAGVLYLLKGKSIRPNGSIRN